MSLLQCSMVLEPPWHIAMPAVEPSTASQAAQLAHRFEVWGQNGRCAVMAWSPGLASHKRACDDVVQDFCNWRKVDKSVAKTQTDPGAP